MGKQLSDSDKYYFLNLKTDEITADFIYSNFARTYNKATRTVQSSKYNTTDTFILKKKEYMNNDEVLTNVGLFITNKLLIEPKFKNVIGYWNTPITAKVLEELDSKLIDALLDNKITRDDFIDYKNAFQWLSMQFNSVFSTSFSPKTIQVLPSVEKKKKELLKKYDSELKNGDVVTAVKVETELKDIARKEIMDDPGMDLYKSGARGSFDNNYKNINIAKGPIFDHTTGEWHFAESNFLEGIKKNELPIYGNTIISGAYPKSIATANSGYKSKQLMAGFQSEVLDENGTDCHTTEYVEITILPSIKKLVLFSYIIEGNKLVLLTNDNISKYYNKVVKLRNTSVCKRTSSGKICSVCAGQMYYKLGTKAIGLTSSTAATTLLNLNMKKFHVLSANIMELDVNDMFI
jgi:hypothetical protein